MSVKAHLRSSGLDPRTAGQIASLVERWLLSCGPEWTAKRLKDLKQLYLKRLVNDSSSVSWISLGYDGLPAGPFRQIFLLKGKKIRRALDALMVYSTIKLKKVTHDQQNKFFSSVQAEPIRVGFIPFLREAVQESKSDISFKKYCYTDYPFFGSRAVPSVKGSKPNVISLLGEERSFSIIRDLYSEFPSVFGDFFQDLLCIHNTYDGDDVLFPYIGRVSCIQERGAKARFIANPLLTVQCLTYSLSRYLEKQLERVASDCTYDQEKGVRWCEQQLSLGKRVYSVDLSDFTNNFPRDLCLRVLHMLKEVPTDHCEYYSSLLDLPWDARRYQKYINDDPYAFEAPIGKLYWTKGTPLGLRPSFPLFSFTHNVLLRAIEMKYGLSDTFRVLGDDVVISNPLTHWAYRRMLDLLGCPVSEPKTLIGHVGEFASYIITKSGSFKGRKHPNHPLLQGAVLDEMSHKASTAKNLRQLSQFVLYWMTRDNSEGLSLKARAHLAYLMGLIKDPFAYDTPAQRPVAWNTMSLLVEILGVDNVFPEMTADQDRITQDAFLDFVKSNPCVAELVSHLQSTAQVDGSARRRGDCKSLNGTCPNYESARHENPVAVLKCQLRCGDPGSMPLFSLFKVPFEVVTDTFDKMKRQHRLVKNRELLDRALRSLNSPRLSEALISEFLSLT